MSRSTCLTNLLTYSLTHDYLYLRANMAYVTAKPPRKPAHAATKTVGKSNCVIWARISFMDNSSWAGNGIVSLKNTVSAALRQALDVASVFGVQLVVADARGTG